MKKKPTNKLKILEFFFYIILLLLIVKNLDVFKKVYNILNYDYNYRISKNSYDYCSKSGIGYLYKIKKEYNLKKNPKIINYNIEARNDWVLLDYNKANSENDIIILNYKKHVNQEFIKLPGYQNLFYFNGFINNSAGIASIEILSNEKIKLNNFFIEIIKVDVGTFQFSEIIDGFELKNYNYKYINKFQINNYENSKTIKLDEFIDNFSDRTNLNIFKFSNLDNQELQKFDKIKVNFINIIDLKDYNILDNYNNKCFLLSKK